MHVCFPQRSRMGTARTEQDKETEEGDKNRGFIMERSKEGTKKSRRPIIYPIKVQYNMHNMVLFYRYRKRTMQFN